MATLSGGHWITVHGHHIYIKGAPLSAQHVGEIADQAQLSGTAKQAVLNAHGQGKLHTDAQIHNAVADIAGAVGVGLDEGHAVSEALGAHSGPDSKIPPLPSNGKGLTTHQIWQSGKGKQKGAAVSVVTHGAALAPGEIADYGAKFGMDKDAVSLIESAHAKAPILNDAHLAQTFADTLHAANTTGMSHKQAAEAYLNGQSASEIIAAHQPSQTPPAAVAPTNDDDSWIDALENKSSPATASGAHSIASDTPPLASLGTKTKADFAAMPDVALPGEAPLPPLKPGQTQSAGILIVEPDGRVWVYEPKGHFAGYTHTFSKGGVESGLTLQQSAHKELYEELGLSAHITGVLGDFETPGTNTRYYIGVRTGGDPKDAESGLTQPGAVETQAVKLVSPAMAESLLNKSRDKQVLAALSEHIANHGVPQIAPVVAGAPVALDLTDWAEHVSDHFINMGVTPQPSAMTSNSHDALHVALISGQLEDHHAAKILEVAASMAKDKGENQVNTGHIQKALWMHGKGYLEPGAVTPTVAPPVVTEPTPISHLADAAQLKSHAKSFGIGTYKTASQELTHHLSAGAVTPDQVPDVVNAAIAYAKSAGAKNLTGNHITSALWNMKSGAPPLAPSVAAPATPIAPVTPVAHHVTIQGQKFPLDHTKTVTATDVDDLKNQVKVSTNGETALKAAIANSTIQNHGQFMEKAAMAQAASLASGHTSVNGTGMGKTAAFSSVESLLDAAHGGDGAAQSYVSHLGAHSFESPAAKLATQIATQKAASDAAFASATPAEHLHSLIPTPKIGFNDGAMFALPGGTQNYVKTMPDAAVAHNEHLANKIYQALGISAPNSKVFEHEGKTKYASQHIENQGHLAAQGITPEVSKQILGGLAADMLLGNHDVLGNGNTPLSNVVVGHDGAPHRIDNGGSLLFTGTGAPKSDAKKSELREWDGFADPKTNANYAKVFAAAGVKNAQSVAGIGQQIKAISALRDAHGGWDGFIKHNAPDMPAAQRAQTAKLLDARTRLLEAKAQTVSGANSLADARKFAYDSAGANHGMSHEQTLIDHHNAHAPALSASEKGAVATFKGGGYSSWNQALMGNSGFYGKQLELTKTLDTMFQKPGMTLGVDSALSRKINISPGERKQLEALAPGTVIAHTPVFQSTSTDSETWGGNVHFCILAPKEMPAITPKAHTSTHAGEREVLLPRGISYRVVSVAAPNGASPANTPSGWKWQTGATRVVMEAIVPGADNGMEHDAVATHMIEHDALKAQAVNLADNHSKAPLPNISGLPTSTIPAWNAGTATLKVAPKVTPKKKAKAAPMPAQAMMNPVAAMMGAI